MGILYLVATPIGNLEDMSLRALRILKEVDLIACEDTRVTGKLLARYGIATPRESHHKFNEQSRAPRLIQMLLEGKSIALVSDSGTPLISDPGYELVSSCRKEGIQVIPIPGPSAAIAALVGSGLPADSFLFAGFLPARRPARRHRLEELAAISTTLVLFETPHRLLASLEDMVAVFGSRQVSIARELTKVHEEFLHGTSAELLELFRARPRIQGEIAIIVGRGHTAPNAANWPISLVQHLRNEIKKTGLSRNEALKAVAKQRGITRKQAYNQLNDELQMKNDE
jgi:16S rRNA (cytidine1402-2'-O)-methyltransferase